MTKIRGSVAELAADLAGAGWAAQPGFLEDADWRALARDAWSRWEEGDFRHAGVGRGADLRVRPEVRSDRVLWIDEAGATSAERRYLERIESLRLALNEQAYLGLFRFEAHYAVYPPGAFYRRHLDRFRGAAHRIVSCVLYLNDDWQAADGGALRIYTSQEGEETRFEDVLPAGGQLVAFHSGRFYHEVLPASRPRLSLTGWLCRRE